MKRIANPIETLELCSYGCGNVAAFVNGSKKLMCCKSSNSCPANRKKNSTALRTAQWDHKAVYAGLSAEVKDKMRWSAGLTKEDPRIKANADSQRGKPKLFTKPMSAEGKDNISKGRIKVILEGKHDSSGRKGHRGHYDNVYFHSSWELAYYVFIKETTSKTIIRNSTLVLNYMFEGTKRRYVPDFIVDGKLIEIKGYLHSDRDHSKFKQTQNDVEYKFSKDLIEEFNYCKEKYGIKFWETLYSV